MRRLLPLLAGLALITGLVFIATEPVAAQDNTERVCELLAELGESCEDDTNPFRRLVGSIVDVLSLIVGATSVIMVIIGGLRYVVSGGDSAKVVAAKNTILYAIVGLVVVIFAQSIVAFVVGRVTG